MWLCEIPTQQHEEHSLALVKFTSRVYKMSPTFLHMQMGEGKHRKSAKGLNMKDFQQQALEMTFPFIDH